MPSPPNTPAMYFLDTKDAKKDCAKDKKDVEKKCAPDEKNRFRGKGKPTLGKAPKGADKAGGWVLDHCGPLLVKPGDNFEEWLTEFKDLNAVMGKLATQLKDKVITKVEQEILQYGAKALTKMAIRRGLTGWIPVVGWIMTAVDVAMTAVDVANKVSELKALAAELNDTVRNLKQQADKITGTFAKYKDKLKNYSKLSKKEQNKVAREVMVDVQSAYAAANPCLRARKCMLVPYNKGGADKWMGKGCCPGQTGHHLLPDAMFRDPVQGAKVKAAWKADPKNTVGGKLTDIPRSKLPTKKCWEGYSEGAAPTICAEGGNQHAGSHGLLHDFTSLGLKSSGYASKPEMPYTRARDLILDEVSMAYGCSKECLRAQLDDYYCGKAAGKAPGCPDCKNAKVVPNSGMGGGSEGDNDSSFED